MDQLAKGPMDLWKRNSCDPKKRKTHWNIWTFEHWNPWNNFQNHLNKFTTGLHSYGNSLQQQFWVQAQGVMFFSLNREIERISWVLIYCITGWLDRRLDSKPKILNLLICPYPRLELYNVLSAECICMLLQWGTVWKMFINTEWNKWLKMD